MIAVGFAYAALILDAWSRRVVGHAIGRSIFRVDCAERRARVVIATSITRVLRRPVETARYLSIRYTERLAEAWIEPSVGSIGYS